MRTKDIAEKYKIDKAKFEAFLKHENKPFSEGFMGIAVDDSNVEAYVEEYRAFMQGIFDKKKAAQKEMQEKKESAHRAALEKKEAAERAAIERRQAAIQEQQNKTVAMAQMLISSGFSFDGYKIVKYSGYISGDDATQIPRSGVFGGRNGENLTQALVKIRRQALMELKEAAYNLGCNAVVGVDFDYITLEPETANIGGGTLYEPYIICVTANGNAVVIEKDDD